MRVLWIVERFPPQRGGVANAAGRQVAAVAPELERLDVLQLTSDLPAGDVVRSEWGGAQVHRLGRGQRSDESLQLLFETGRLLVERCQHHLVHGFYAVYSGYLATLIGRATARPSLVSLRGNDVDRAMFQGSRAPFLRWTLQHADAVCAVSRELAAKVGMLVDRDDATVLANGVDCAHFTPSPPAAEPPKAVFGHPRPWLGFSGELRFKKGLRSLLELAEHLAAEQTGTLFAIGGARADEARQIERFRRASPSSAKRLVEIPYVRDQAELKALYGAIDLFLFPSLWDGLPNALLEVMASKKPVLATAVGGIPDVIEDGESGYLLGLGELGSFPERALAIARELERDDGTAARIGAAARKRVEGSFSAERERDALLELYRATTAKARG